MTRINAGIQPKYLTDQHLLAEHREIIRITKSFIKWFNSDNRSKIPDTFRLGKGHVLFFIDKGLFTFNRYRQLHEECLRRGFKVTDYSANWKPYRKKFYNDYIPTNAAVELLLKRISSNIKTSNQIPRYYRQVISKQQAIKQLENDNNRNYNRRPY